MERLPDEILIMILDYLPHPVLCLVISRVCRRWARVAETRALLVGGACALRRWAAGGARVVLVTAQNARLKPALLHLPAVERLTHLTVHLGLALSTAELLLLAKLQLQHVDVFCRAEVLNVAAVPLAARVTSLVINEPLAVSFLHSLADGCRLKALHMYGRAGYYPRRELLELLRSRSDHFEELTLRCHNLREGDYAAIGRCRGLRSLQLYCCRELTPAAALHLAALQGLRKLHLTGTLKWMDDEAILEVVDLLPRGLDELALSAVRLRDVHAAALARRAARLRRLELWRTHMTASGLLRLTAALPLLQELDVDLALEWHELHTLAQHPALHTVRCRLPQGKVESRLRLLDIANCHGSHVRRNEGDGYRAQLFYYWTQDVPLALTH